MELIGGLIALAMLAFIICVGCYLLFMACICLLDLFEMLSYPFMRLRCFIAGADDRFAPQGRLLLALLISKLAAALVVGAIALYLGASYKVTAIAASVAFLSLG